VKSIRDQVRHARDARDPRVTLTAAEVLTAGVDLWPELTTFRPGNETVP